MVSWHGITTTAAAASYFILSTARLRDTVATSARIPNHILFVSLIITPSALGELHDLDHDGHHGYEGTVGNDNGGASEAKHNKLMDQQHGNNVLDDQDDEYASKTTNIPNVIDRFSHAIANEIIRRIPFIQTLWRKQQQKRKKKIKPDVLKQGEGFVDVGSMPHDIGKTNIDIHSERRVGAWCPSDSSAASDAEVDIIIDKSVVPCSPESSTGQGSAESCHVMEDDGDDSINNINDVQPGMVVYIFPQGKFNEEPPHASASSLLPESSANSLERMKSNVNDDDDVNDVGSNDGSIRGTRCLLEMGQHYDDDEQVVQYTLLQQDPVELGNIDVHRKDFAYQPVALTIDDGGIGGSSRQDDTWYTGHQLETRIKPEDEAIETTTRPLPSPQQSYWNNDGDDQQVSFRWWSWVSHISSQILHQGKSYTGDDGALNSDVVVSDSSEPRSYRYPDEQQQSTYQSHIYEEDGKRPFAGGSHGEIWRARRRCPVNDARQGDETRDNSTDGKPSSCDDGKDLIVKRLKIEYGYAVLEAGLREVYFGELLAREVESSNLFTTYVDHFFREGAQGQIELWIVFENAGPSLRSFLYTPVDTAGGFMVFQHSAFWRRLRRGIAGGKQCKGCDDDEALAVVTPILYPDIQMPGHRQKSNSERDAPGGRELLREVLEQLISATAFLHERGIVHRDIKPSNVMCKTTPPAKSGVIPHRIEAVRCILGDFSSAWDEFSSRNLYANGPSSNEQTDEYAPPEVLFHQGPSWTPFSHKNPFSYDSWSIGIVALELLLGTPNVFSVDQRTTALLTNRLKKEGASSQDIQRALYLAALSQFCIYVPTESEGKNWPLRRGDPLHKVNVVKNKCTLNDFHSALRARDPLGIGFGDDENTLLHLVWRLLDWNPVKRLTASEALEHPYFAHQSNYRDWNPIFLHTKLFDTVVVPGSQNNALEDPRLSSDRTIISEFVCPCGKIFTDHNSCQTHARARKHAKFCTYDRSLLPQCLNAHSMLPTHPTSGYCDIQGRRKTIEDFHTVHLGRQSFYGVFDGHLGNLASKYAASSFYHKIEECLSNVDSIRNESSQSNWKEDVTSKVVQSFEDLHRGIIGAVTSSPGGVMDESGTTATILYVTLGTVIIANVGDSRAIMSRWLIDEKGNERMTALQLTVDHVASSKKEQMQIIERGGFVSESGGIDRVNGSLAVSRSLGDIKLAHFLSRTPHVTALTKEEAYDQCGKHLTTEEQSLPCFIILASDGLWDVMSNQDAVDLAWQVIKKNKSGTAYQEAAEVLTQEAYVRGSSDNIGVCVVAIM
eukprot:CAMPEP_0172331272 /NCGR_PEP_ID=MMETSP1058-20130122/61842_1 /TAXON_ID=83371 /ORGANISM="Detonula confervacea, Strain CCMP 353" /LENGTH=1290 /DNA_ID=CAMNT_0013048535 /DNA_START=357 /DNA_END=4229 /DNA_ORIENTATION=+